MVLSTIVKNNAQKFPSNSALTMRMGFRTVTLTYKNVYDISRQVALLLQAHGVQTGDKVLLLAPNSPYWITIFWGCVLAGVVVVPLNVQSRPDMVEKIADQTGAKLFFAHTFYRHSAPGSLPRFDSDILPEYLGSYDPEEFVQEEVSENDLVEILYTSGTTGDPKGVMLTHKNLFSNIKAGVQMATFIYGKDRMLSILPLSHIFEQAGGFLLPYYYGVHIIYAHSPAAIGALLHEYRITKMIAVPEFLKILMNKIDTAVEEKGKVKIFNKLLQLSSKISIKWFSRLLFRSVLKKLGGKLDTIMCGGAPLDEALEKKWNALGITLFQGYGLTETSPLVSSNTLEEHKCGSVGKVAPGVTVRLSKDSEIEVKGPNVFSGYYKNPEKTQEVFTKDGFFKTEDVGEFDDDGFLFIRGRKKYMILGPGGQNIFPEDIEEVLQLDPEVKDSCVVGLAKPNGMVEIHAVLLLDEDHKKTDDIVAQANEKLASYQQILGFSVWPDEDFPRSATKKIKKDIVLEFLSKQKEEQLAGSIQQAPVITLLVQMTGLPQGDITFDTKLGALQLDSLMRIELIAQVEEMYGVFLDETELKVQTTVLELETMIREKKPIKGLAPLRKWPRTKLAGFFRVMGHFFLFWFMRIFVKLRVHGLENIKNGTGQFIFMPNHTSYLDSLVFIAALPRHIRKRVAFAAANDALYEDFSSLVWFAELYFNTFPFPRKEHENIKLGLDYMGRLLDQNCSITIFPEGKMTTDGKLVPLKRGAGLIAVEMGVSVIPVIIKGANEVLPYAEMVPRKFRGLVTVTFGKPLVYKKTDSYVQATQEIHDAMQKLVE